MRMAAAARHVDGNRLRRNAVGDDDEIARAELDLCRHFERRGDDEIARRDAH